MSGPSVLPAKAGDVVVRTSTGRVYVLRVDGALPPWMDDGCVKAEPIYTFRTRGIRARMLADMVAPGGDIEVSWVVEQAWVPLLRAPEFFRVQRGVA